jgi:hypothetical protein
MESLANDADDVEVLAAANGRSSPTGGIGGGGYNSDGCKYTY